MSTLRTLARRVARVNENDRYAVHLRLVLNKHPKLEETPTMPLCSVSLFSPNPRTDALQVFQRNPSLRVFGFQHNRFADFVVQLGGETFLFQRSLLQKTLGRGRTFALKFRSQSAVTLPQIANVRAAETLAFAISGNPGNAQINTQEAGRLIRGRLNHIDRSKKVEPALAKDQIALALTRVEQDALTRTTDEGDLLTAFNCPDRNVISAETQNPVIVSYRAVCTKDTLAFFIELVGMSDFRHHSDGDLSRQAELISDGLVREFMKLELAESLGLPGDARDFIGGGIRLLKRLSECGELLGSRFQFQSNSQLHGASLTRMLHI